ncbi:uncharacterized protein F4807DRAFT_394112 [Annulohypoxylon truncatum]|uniref:uncharacterized protein n=1 Tax=Annulohypoxylon truncatum TaxID=327061 RepID=UPI002007CBE3|nr:uncharacterized protein F4807DRAFT_394112 [Annulohypoxylon truncatum]KAI1211557.1 hypothetical protein F4807DRAFT_394112 [Annulohypoxylon truncatum]
MKYGEHFEEESVPSWGLHNIDYNSLKHQIKAHTTKDQATAIAIPGQQDYALKRFEDAFYFELCNQHNRVGLFVTSKADEISRRLRHLSDSVHQLIVRCNNAGGVSPKRQRRLAKYALQIDECDDDIKALSRFVNAQIIAFRKILKKYRKWTGSTTLGSRFKENILSSPKSFTRRDITPLRLQHRELLTTLEAASPDIDSFQAERQKQKQKANSEQPNHSRRSSPTRKPKSSSVSTPGGSSMTYWNEYDHGSEAGDYEEGGYALYIDPNANADFPGFVYVKTMFTAPMDKVRQWLKTRSPHSSERQSLLSGRGQSPVDYFSTRHSATAHTTDNETTEDEYASSLNSSIGRRNKSKYAALPATEEGSDYQIALYHDKVLTRAVILAFVTAFILLAISGILIATGRHKMRLEVDAGVTVGSVASLFCSCMGLGAMLYRRYPVGFLYTLAVWAAFVAVCALNGMLLVLVVGSNGL